MELIEVWTGVQFQAPPNFDELSLYELRALFGVDYAKTSAVPYLPPSFEVFGLQAIPQNFPQIQFGPASTGNRYHLQSADGSCLYQIQADRLLFHKRHTLQKRVEFKGFGDLYPGLILGLKNLENFYLGRFSYVPPYNQVEMGVTLFVSKKDLSENDIALLKELKLDKDLFSFERANFSYADIHVAVGGKIKARRFIEGNFANHPFNGDVGLIVNIVIRGHSNNQDSAGVLSFLQCAEDKLASLESIIKNQQVR